MVSRSRNFPNFNGTFEHDPASRDACMAGGGKKKPFPRRASHQFTYCILDSACPAICADLFRSR
eukprot:1287486-Prymnesium_polylepis.1